MFGCVRILWVFLFIVGLFFAIIWSWTLWNNWSSNPVITTLETSNYPVTHYYFFYIDSRLLTFYKRFIFRSSPIRFLRYRSAPLTSSPPKILAISWPRHQSIFLKDPLHEKVEQLPKSFWRKKSYTIWSAKDDTIR